MGRRKLKILIIGLPLFAKRVAEDLAKFDTSNSYTALNTYYSKKDKLKYYLKIKNADIIYSINGTLNKSGSIDLALKQNKKVIFHWVGTDVLRSTLLYNENKHQQKYIDECTHWCEVDWIQKELKEISIKASIVNFAVFDINKKPLPVPKDFYVLSYISQDRSEYYGINEIKELAREFPHIHFKIMGCTFQLDKLPNIEFLGWVTNASELIENSVVCIRFTEHDGLSNFVLEALSKGREVLYNNNFPNVSYTKNVDELKIKLKHIFDLYQKGELSINTKGHRYIEEHFNKKIILEGLISRFDKIMRNE